MEKYKQHTKNVVHRALRNGVKDEILELLDNNIDLNNINEDGDTVLHVILKNEKLIEKHVVRILPVLLSQGVSPNIANEHGQTSLHLAVERRMKDAIDLLLKFEANLHAVNKTGGTIAHFFIEDEYKKCKLAMLYPIMNTEENREIRERCSVSFLEYLISKNVDFDHQNKGRHSALYLAIMYQLLHILPTLFEHTNDVWFVEKGKTLLHYFLEKRSMPDPYESERFNYNSEIATKCVSTLLDRRLPILKCEKYGCTLVSMTINNREETGIIEALISFYLSKCNNIKIATTLQNELVNTCDSWNASESEYFLIILSDLETKIADIKKTDVKKTDVKKTVPENRYASTRDSMPLHDAVMMNETTDAIGLVLANGADVNAVDSLDNTPLHLAVSQNTLVIVKLLLDHGASASCKNKQQLTPLHFIRWKTDEALKVADLLLSNGADVNAKDSARETPFHLAVINDNMEIVSLFLQNGVEVNCKSSFELTPLHRALLKETVSMQMIELLLTSGAEVNTKDYKEETPLHLAVSKNNLPIVRLLIEHGASVMCRNKYGQTPLHRAIIDEAVQIVELLLANKADVNAKDSASETPFHLAAISDNAAMVLLFLQNGAEINCKNRLRLTPLHRALLSETVSQQMIELLLRNGAKVNTKDHKGETPLHLVVSRNNLKMVRLLIEHGAFVMCRNKYGQTPLHCDGSSEIVELLLANGADVNARDHEGNRPLHHICNRSALNYDVQRIVRLLLDKGAQVNASNNLGSRALSLALAARNDVAKELMNYGHSKVYCLEHPFRDVAFSDRRDDLMEIKKLQSTAIGNDKSLFDFLRMRPGRRCAHINSEKIQRLIGSPNLHEQFPIYSCVILARYQEAVTRKSLEKLAQEALYAMTRVLFADSVDKILALLENEDLIDIAQANVYDDAGDNECDD